MVPAFTYLEVAPVQLSFSAPVFIHCLLVSVLYPWPAITPVLGSIHLSLNLALEPSRSGIWGISVPHDSMANEQGRRNTFCKGTTQTGM